MEDKDFDCQKCGACCGYFHESDLAECGSALAAVAINPNKNNIPKKYIQIGPKVEICDSIQDAENGISYETSLFVRPNGLKCSALQGEIGKTTRCKIYENRPSICKNFETGSEKCLAARNAKLNTNIA